MYGIRALELNHLDRLFSRSGASQTAEAATIKPLPPDQQRIKSMQARVKQDQVAVKAERARQKIRASQNLLNQLSRT